MPPETINQENMRFVREHQIEYCAWCGCAECERFRGILGLEPGEEFDAENFDFADEGNEIEGDCELCEENEANFALNNGGKACATCMSEDKIGLCGYCDNFFFVGDYKKFNRDVRAGNEGICPDCVENEEYPSFECGLCEDIWPDDENNTKYTTRSGLLVCNDCKRHNSTECNKCDDLIVNVEFNGEFLGPGEGHVCRACIDIYYEMCDDCGEIRDAENLTGCRCPEDRIHNYTFVPHNLGFFTGKTQKGGRDRVDDYLYFGVEIEVECTEGDKARGSRFLSREDFFWCKRDASLDRGFEVVSHPFTWSWFRENKNVWVQKFATLKEMGFLSYNTTTCGMHVHLDKGQFSRLHLYKFMKLVYDNKPFILDISERRKDQLELYAGIEKENGKIPEKAKHMNQNFIPPEIRREQGDDEGHYVAVNLQKRNTVELRVFRGCLGEDRLMKNMEFCKALYDFTRQSSIKGTTVPNFVEYVENRSQDYSYLHRFLSSNGYC